MNLPSNTYMLWDGLDINNAVAYFENKYGPATIVYVNEENGELESDLEIKIVPFITKGTIGVAHDTDTKSI